MSLNVVNPPSHPILADHAHVRELLSRAANALASPPVLPAEDPVGVQHVEEWRNDVRERCSALRSHLERHFAMEEASPMYKGAPEFVRFEAELKVLLEQHDAIRAGLEGADRAVATEHPDVAARFVHGVLETIAEHERTENAILQDALTSDIGVGD